MHMYTPRACCMHLGEGGTQGSRGGNNPGFRDDDDDDDVNGESAASVDIYYKRRKRPCVQQSTNTNKSDDAGSVCPCVEIALVSKFSGQKHQCRPV